MSEEAHRMMLLLAGSESAHGTFDPGARQGGGVKVEIKSSARTLREPVTEELWDLHIQGRRPLGVIPLREDDTCVWGCIDVDQYNLVHAELVERIRSAGMPLVLTRSKSGGAHLFLFLREPVPAAQLMQHLRGMASRLGLGGSEIFPKQSHLLRDKGDLGNWIVMPYFGQTGEGVKHTGALMTIQEFIRAAEAARVDLTSQQLPAGEESMEDGPPCLQHLSAAGFPEGTRNNGLFALGVYARKKWPEGWEEHLEDMNRRFMRPPLPSEEVTIVIKSLRKKEYNYKCNDVPLVSHCDSPLCRTRRFGVGDPGSLPAISGLSVLTTDPPLWFLDIDGHRLELSTEQLQNYRLFHKVCMEQMLVCYRLLSQPVWLGMVGRAMETATRIDAPPEVSTRGHFHEEIEDFCTNTMVGTREEDILSGRPWDSQDDQRIYFRLRDLQNHLEKKGLRGLTRAQITQRIRDLQGSTKFLHIRGRGVSTWFIPHDSVQRMPDVGVPPLSEDPI